MMATGLALLMLAMAFAFVSSTDETDAADSNLLQEGDTVYLSTGTYYVTMGNVKHTNASLKNNSYIYIVSGGNTYIAEEAFANCTCIESVVVSDNVKGIGKGAFKGCTNLEYFKANCITDIRDEAFMGSGVSTFVLKDCLATIGTDTFRDCTNLERFNLDQTQVTSLPSGAFANTGMGAVDVRKLTYSHPDAFEGTDLRWQIVGSSQSSMVPGADRIEFDGSTYYHGVMSTGGTVYITIWYHEYAFVTDEDGRNVPVVYEDPADVNFIASFNPERGKTLTLSLEDAKVVFPEDIGMGTDTMGPKDSKYTMPGSMDLGDMTITGWNVKGMNGLVTEITISDMVSLSGMAVVTPVVEGTAELTMSHSAVSAYTDVSALPTTMEYTYGDVYPDIQDVTGYEFKGWMVGSTQYGPGDRITEFSSHTAVSVWEPTHLLKLIYDGADAFSEHAYGTTANVDPGIVLDGEEGQRFEGWSTDGTTVLGTEDGIPMTADTTLTPVYSDRTAYTITYTADGDTVSTRTGYDGRTYDLDEPAPECVRIEQVFLHWAVDGVETASITLSGNTTVEAVWRDRLQYAVVFMDGGEVLKEDVKLEGVDYTVSFRAEDTGTTLFVEWSDGETAVGVGDIISEDAAVTLTAVHRDREVCTVTFDDGFGNTSETECLKGIGISIGVDDPVDREVIFVCWTDTEGNTYSKGDAYIPDGDSTLTAKWRDRAVYTVTFDDGFGGRTEVESREGLGIVISIDNPVNEEGIFLHWADAAGNSYSKGDGFVPTGDATLTAQWRDRQVYTVTYDDGSGYKMMTESLEGLGIIVSIDDPVSENRVFVCWRDAANGSYNRGDSFVPTGDATLTAQWRYAETYTVTISDGIGNRSTVESKEGVGFVIDMDDPVSEDRVFVCWRDQDGNSYSKGDRYIPEGDGSLTAEWRDRQVYTVTYDDGRGNRSSVESVEGVGIVIDARDPVSEDGIFVCWTDPRGNAYSRGDTYVPEGDSTLTAKWRERGTHIVYFTDGYGGVFVKESEEGVGIVIDMDDPVSEDRVFLCWTDSSGKTYSKGDTFVPSDDATLTAKWRDRAVYTVTFDDGFGNRSTVESKEGIGIDIAIDDPVSDDGIFVCWKDAEGGSYAAGDRYVPDRDSRLTAEWRDREVYTVSFSDGNGGTVTERCEEGVGIVIDMDDPVSEDRIFVCWTDSSGKTYSKGDTFVPTGDSSLSAVWRDREVYTVSFDDGQGNRSTVESKEGVGIAIAVDNPASKDRVFVCWTDSSGRTYSKGDRFVPEGDATLTAKWRSAEVFTITYDDGNGNAVTVECGEGEGIAIDMDDPVSEDRIFVCWTDADGNEYRKGDVYVPADDSSLTAKWRDREVYTVTFTDGNGGTVTAECKEGVGMTVDMEDPVSDDGIFVCWRDQDGNPYSKGDTFVPEGDTTLAAEWRDRETYTVTIIGGDGETITIESEEGEGIVIDMDDPVSEDGIFVCWTDSDGNEYRKGDVYVPTGDSALSAQWRDREVYTVTFTGEDGGIVTAESEEGVGIAIDVEDPVSEGKVFVCWTDADGNEYRRGDTIGPDGDMTLTAVFRDAESFTLTLIDGETVVGELLCYEGSGCTISIPDPVSENMEFAGWSDGADVYFAGDTIAISGDAELHATWDAVAPEEPPESGADDGGDSGDSDVTGDGEDVDTPGSGDGEQDPSDDTDDPTGDGTDGDGPSSDRIPSIVLPDHMLDWIGSGEHEDLIQAILDKLGSGGSDGGNESHGGTVRPVAPSGPDEDDPTEEPEVPTEEPDDPVDEPEVPTEDPDDPTDEPGQDPGTPSEEPGASGPSTDGSDDSKLVLAAAVGVIAMVTAILGMTIRRS